MLRSNADPYGDIYSVPSPCSIHYPASAIRLGLEGTTVVRIRVDKNGHIYDARIERSSGHIVLDKYALRMARTCKVFRAHHGGSFKLEYVFTLE
jgi:TonB family protein